MESTSVLKAEIRGLATKALGIVNNDRLSTAEKRRQLDDTNRDLELAMKHLKSVESSGSSFEANGIHPMLFGEAGPTDGFRAGPGRFGGKAMGMGAPSLDIPDHAYERLFEAASSRKMLTLDSVELSTKTVDTADASMATVPHYNLPPVPFSREGTRILDLIPASATSAGKEIFWQATSGAASASAVAEGATKPESNLVYTQVEAPVVKIAHWIEVTEEALMDYTAFQGVVAMEMSAGVIAAENHQLLLGSGTLPDMRGLLNTTGILTRAKSSDTRLDALAKAITDLRVGAAFAEADGIVMHPNDWLETTLEKSSGAGNYMATDPLRDPSRTLWGLPVTLTTDITEGTTLVGCFKEACRAWIRSSLRIEVNPWAESQFKANKVLILAEERIAMGALKPKALIAVTGM